MGKLNIDDAFEAWYEEVNIIEALGVDIVSLLLVDAYNGIDIRKAVQNRIDGAFDEYMKDQIREYELARAGI